MQATQPNNAEPAPTPLWMRFVVGRNPKRTLIRAAILAILTTITFCFVLLPVRVTGISMEPTYRDRSVNLINRWAYVRSTPKRGDVVAVKEFRTLGNPRPHIMFLKRIIAVPGETVVIRAGTVYIEGEPLDEGYIRYKQPWEDGPYKLAPDEYLVIGDNRGMPKEQHEYGRAKISQIVGKALW